MKNNQFKSLKLFFAVFVFIAMATSSCKEEKSVLTEHLNFHFCIVDKQVEFIVLYNHGDVFQWDFGDGSTSTDENPVHTYTEGGVYEVTLRVTSKGEMKSISKDVSIALSNLQMLAGANRHPNGKKWKMSNAHSPTDRVAVADANFTNFYALGASAFDGSGLAISYGDEYLFKLDGSYQHLPQNGGSLSGRTYVTNNGITIITEGNSYAQPSAFDVCYAAYTPEPNATYTFVEKEDFTITTVTGSVTYRDVMTLDFSGTEFMGFMDYTRKCIVVSLTVDKMQLALFQNHDGATVPNRAMLITFEEVR